MCLLRGTNWILKYDSTSSLKTKRTRDRQTEEERRNLCQYSEEITGWTSAWSWLESQQRSDCFSSSKHPDLLRDPTNLVFNGHRETFLQNQGGRGVKLINDVIRSEVNNLNNTSPPPYAFMARTRTNMPLTLRWLMSYIYGAPILDVSRSHTTTQHSR